MSPQANEKESGEAFALGFLTDLFVLTSVEMEPEPG